MGPRSHRAIIRPVSLALSPLDLSDSSGRTLVNAFLDGQIGAHPFQYPGWVQAGRELGGDAEILVGREGGELRFVAALTRFRLRRYLPIRGAESRYDPVALDEESLDEGLALLAQRESRTVHLDVHPNISPEAGSRVAELLAPKGWSPSPVAGTVSTLIVELGSDSELLASFRKTTRHEIVRAQRAGVVVRIDSEAEVFAQLHGEMTSRKGLPPSSPDLFAAVARWFRREPGRGCILVASGPGGEPIGGVVVLRAGPCAWYTWGATRRVPGANAGHLLQFEAMRWSRELGCTRYDFGGYVPGGPVATFKAGFSGTLVPFAPGYRLTRKGPAWLVARLSDSFRGAAA